MWWLRDVTLRLLLLLLSCLLLLLLLLLRLLLLLLLLQLLLRPALSLVTAAGQQFVHAECSRHPVATCVHGCM
jgi:hypothetical protein